MIKTVIKNGPPGSGKDFVTEYLCQKNNWNHMEFKRQLFIETCERFNVSLKWFMEDYDSNKEIPQPILEGMSKRQSLIDTSENHIKLTKGKDYFGLCSADKLVDGVNVFSDGGFIEELVPVIEKSDSVIIVQIYRPGCSFDNDSRKYINPEDVLPYIDIDKVQWFKVNNASSKDYFKHVVEARLSDMLHKTRKSAATILTRQPNTNEDGIITNISDIDDNQIKLLDANHLLSMIELCQTFDDLIFVFKCLVAKNYHIKNDRDITWDSNFFLEVLLDIKNKPRYINYLDLRVFTRSYGLRSMVKALCNMENN